MIQLINVNKFIEDNSLVGPVDTPNIFFGKTLQFHPSGLFSEEIFGIVGSMERKQKFSWIELNCNVIQPPLYDILSKRIERNIDKYLNGSYRYTLGKNNELLLDKNGEYSGFQDFYRIIDKVNFRSSPADTSSIRNQLISMIKSYINKGLFFTNRLIVIPPDFRPIFLAEDQRESTMDEMNKIYQKIINLSNQIYGLSGVMYDILSYKIQLVLYDLYNYIKSKISKKAGMIRSLMLGKRVDFAATAVITPNPNLRLGEVGIPLIIACKIFEPYLIYGLVNSPAAQHIPQEFHDEVLRFLQKESESVLN